MKKQTSFLFILLAISTSTVIAQKSSAILRGGLNLANVSTKSDGTADEANILTTFQVGIIGDLPITSFLYIQPGLLFSGKGSKAQSGQPTDANYYRAEVNPYYIEIPVNVVPVSYTHLDVYKRQTQYSFSRKLYASLGQI